MSDNLERKFAKLHEYRGRKFLIHTYSCKLGRVNKYSFELLSEDSGRYYQEHILCENCVDALCGAYKAIDGNYKLSGYDAESCHIVIG